MQPRCRCLQRVDGDAAELLRQSFLHHIGQRQSGQSMGLEDLGQHPGQFKFSITAAEADQSLARIPVLGWTEEFSVKSVCFHSIYLVCGHLL